MKWKIDADSAILLFSSINLTKFAWEKKVLNDENMKAHENSVKNHTLKYGKTFSHETFIAQQRISGKNEIQWSHIE